MTDTIRRDALIAQAVAAGKLSQARAAHYAAQYDKDPVGTERLLASLAPVPVLAGNVLGHGGDEVDRTLAAGRALIGNRGVVASAPTAATREPVHAQHLRPVEQVEGNIELTPANVEQWTRELFPETRATAEGQVRQRVTSDMKYQRGASAA
jgi:hypothetical protein